MQKFAFQKLKNVFENKCDFQTYFKFFEITAITYF